MNAHKWSERAVNALTALMVLALVSMVAPPVVVHAATTRTIGVDNISDGFPLLGCTLREAISIANAGLTGTHDGCTVTQSGSGVPITYHIYLPKGGYLYTLAGMAGVEEDNNLSGDLDITANVHISGWGAGTTIIDGAEKDRVFHICPGGGCGNSVTLSGMTIRNGNTIGSAGGGICHGGDMLIVQNCTIGGAGTGNNSDSLGGGIYTGGVVMVIGSTIISNTATGDGGGIFSSSTLTVDDSIVSHNKSNHGAGLYMAVGRLDVRNGSVVSENTATGSGGGILSSGTLTVTSSTISDNTAYYGGGIYNWGSTWDGKTTVDGSTISGNKAQNRGAGICNYEGTLTVQNGSIISDNTAEEGGGGVWNHGGTLAMTGSTVSDNTAEEDGGGIWNEGTLTVTSSTISGNLAYRYGGGICSDEGTVTVDDSTISDNLSAGPGGGIRNAGGTLTVQNSTISDNKVSGTAWGGGILNYADAVVDGSTISDNWAGGGGGIATFGTLTVTDSRILNNTAVYDSGGVSTYANVVGATSVTGSCIMGNSDTSFFNVVTETQTATGNWWGSASGPSGVGPGTGDSVSDNVDYSGFLTEPILGCYPYTYLPLVLRDSP
jgi:predicted outer membrane repeat protein